jgi:hypothetical protein
MQFNATQDILRETIPWHINRWKPVGQEVSNSLKNKATHGAIQEK